MYQLYEVKVAAATFSIINPKKIILGKFSEAKKVSEMLIQNLLKNWINLKNNKCNLFEKFSRKTKFLINFLNKKKKFSKNEILEKFFLTTKFFKNFPLKRNLL